MIKAVIFDLDDTLYDYKSLNKVAIEKLSNFVNENLGVNNDAFYLAFEKARNDTKNHLGDVASSHNRMIYFQKTLENLNINPFSFSLEMYNFYWDYILENMKPYKYVMELFNFIKSSDIKIGICTDLTVRIQHKKIRKLGIGQYIDAIVTSEEAGREKPNRGIFEMILKKLEIDRQEVLYVGDNYDRDIVGAFDMGIKAVLYSSNNKKYDCEIIENHKQLMEIIDGENKK